MVQKFSFTKYFVGFGVKVNVNVWGSTFVYTIVKSANGLIDEFVQLKVRKVVQSKVEKSKASANV